MNTQFEMNKFAEKSFREKDKIMNDIIDNLLSEFEENKDLIELIKESQNAWLIYREKQARIWSEIVKGGSMYAMIYCNHMARLTDQRIDEMNNLIDREEGCF